METTSKTLTMTGLENIFNRAINTKEEYVGVRIKYPKMVHSKIVIFAKEDFQYALESFKITYDYDLSHKLLKDTKITGFIYGDNFAEIQDWLNC